MSPREPETSQHPSGLPFGLIPGAPATISLLGVPVVMGPTPPPWDAPFRTNLMCADEERALGGPTGGPNVYIESGQSITYSARSAAERLAYDHWVYSFALRMLLLQQGRFSLHASVVRSPAGVTTAIMGNSGAGKSTTTAELMHRGWSFVCDDVLEVSATPAGVQVLPHARPVHLAPAALERLGIPADTGRLLPNGRKRVVRLPGDLRVSRLDLIIDLAVTNADSAATTDLTRALAFVAIANKSSANGVSHATRIRGTYLDWCAAISEQVPVVRIARPSGVDSVDEVASYIESAAAPT